ncbi:hypothetical protein [Aurantiacibacter marinus]|uniref:hypothetical protein n=1 Tax=Aurantiacibacter marinus TaxID=874156 RepID=UPI000AA99212|nr:hypothetical protein [Aurantiacibacter marinus]
MEARACADAAISAEGVGLSVKIAEQLGKALRGWENYNQRGECKCRTRLLASF